MTGHVYAVRADLTRLACDVAMPSCDAQLNITRSWSALLPPGLPRGDHDSWLRLPSEHSDGVVVRLPRPTAEAGSPWVVPLIAIEGSDTPASVAARVGEGIGRVAPELRAGGGRVLPLVALPLVGSADGGLGGQRGDLIKSLLPVLRDVARTCAVDIALTLRDPRDVAAVQARRSAEEWEELSTDLLGLADELGHRAATGELSLFLGAGVSMPVGLPGWSALVEALAVEADVDLATSEPDLLDRASALRVVLGQPRYQAVLQRLLTTERHALSHALLASLGVKQAVTTNFDRCYENALVAVHGDRFRVLTRALAGGGEPWLLKLHGDMERPESLVFTAEDYRRHPQEYQAVRGVVQSLMLTSHLLFVGFGMNDANFLDLATAVTKVRREAEEADGERAGTVLALSSADVDHQLRDDLDFRALLPGGETRRAARQLEIFLDRLAWTAATSHHLGASYLLDERYRSNLSPSDRDLREALENLLVALPDSALSSQGWSRVARMLTDLGHPDVPAHPSPGLAPAAGADSAIGVQLKILRAVAELHALGYQQVRARTGMSPSGMHWRATVTAGSVGRIDYSSASGNTFAGIEITPGSTPAEIADAMLVAMPGVTEPQSDEEYAEWYAGLLELVLEHDRLPVAFADYFDDSEGWAIGWGSGVRYPHPPARNQIASNRPCSG